MEKKYNMILESDNLYYTKVSYDLINDYLKMINDENIQKLISTKRRVVTYAEEKSWVDRKLESNKIIFSIIEKETDEFVGNVEFMDETEDSAEMGITITPEKQGKHYGTEAIKKMIDYAFNTLKLKEITLVVFSNNTRAIHCYQKLGFTEYKVDKAVAVIDGNSIDDIHMKLKR